ncbi:hypothetical protein [Mycobacterium asiaticum]|uniref:hypothetical protein n=1 Tax=Mycobacterium asiaticum TaxID=1790 RepID=UPI00264A3229|nr:hypothetical protein [Mycobacterium asiaticum]
MRLEESEVFATCPLTQESLVRCLLRTGQSAAVTRDVVTADEGMDRHEFWSGSVSFADVEMGGWSVTDR